MTSCNWKLKGTKEIFSTDLGAIRHISHLGAGARLQESIINPDVSVQRLKTSNGTTHSVFHKYFGSNANSITSENLLKTIVKANTGNSTSNVTLAENLIAGQHAATDTAKKARSERKKSRRQRVLTKLVQSPEEEFLSFIAGGGKMSREDFLRHTGLKGADAKQFNWMLSDDGAAFDTFSDQTDFIGFYETLTGADQGNFITDLILTYANSLNDVIDELEYRQGQDNNQFGEEYTEQELSYDIDKELESEQVDKELDDLLSTPEIQESLNDNLSDEEFISLFYESNNNADEQQEEASESNQENSNSRKETPAAGSTGAKRKSRRKRPYTAEKLKTLRVRLAALQKGKASKVSLTTKGISVGIQSKSWVSDEALEALSLVSLIEALAKGNLNAAPNSKVSKDLLDLQLSIINGVTKGKYAEDLLGTFDGGHSLLLYGLTGQKVIKVDDLDISTLDPFNLIKGLLSIAEMGPLLQGMRFEGGATGMYRATQALSHIISASVSAATLMDVISKAQEYSELIQRDSNAKNSEEIKRDVDSKGNPISVEFTAQESDPTLFEAPLIKDTSKHLEYVSRKQAKEAKQGRTEQGDFVEAIRNSKEEPYSRTNLENEDLRYTFIPGAADAEKVFIDLQVKDRGNSAKLIVHPDAAEEVNSRIRKALFGEEVADFVIGGLVYFSGNFHTVKSVKSFEDVVVNKQGDLVKITGYEIATTFGDIKTKVIKSLDSKEISLEATLDTLEGDVRANLVGSYTFTEDAPGAMRVEHAFAVSPDKMNSQVTQAVIDEDSFYRGESDSVVRNNLLADVFEAVTDVTVFSNRIVGKDPKSFKEEVQEKERQNRKLEYKYSEILETDGTINKATLGKEFTKNSTKYAVSGLLQFLDSGAIGVSAEQVESTEGLPVGLSSMPAFCHKGKIYINMDHIGEEGVYRETKLLFLDHVQRNDTYLFAKIAGLVKDSQVYEDLTQVMPDAEEKELVMTAYMMLTSNHRHRVPAHLRREFTGTLNEFINSVDKTLGEIDPKLNWQSKLTEVALGIDDAARSGSAIFRQMLNNPDIEAAKMSLGKHTLMDQMNNLLIDLTLRGKITKICN